LLTEKPAQMLGIADRKGRLAPGYDADFITWLPGASAMIKASDILYKHKISPYVSHELYGEVRRTFVGGELVFENGNIINKNKGKWVLKK
jgi:allantoinase